FGPPAGGLPETARSRAGHRRRRSSAQGGIARSTSLRSVSRRQERARRRRGIRAGGQEGEPLMSRLAMLTGLLLCAGCFTAAPPEAIVPVKTAVVMRPSQPLPAVMPEQVNESNGHQVAQSLEDEINREQQQSMLNAAPH